MNRKLRIISVLILIFALVFAVWNMTTRKIEKDRESVSDDSLSLEIAERWSAGLPKGFSKIEVNDIDENGKGYLFAALTYDEPIDSLLIRWDEASETQIAAFQEMLDEQCADAAVSQAHKDLIAGNRPQPDKSWIGYTAEHDKNQGARLILLYDFQTKTMYLAERQP